MFSCGKCVQHLTPRSHSHSPNEVHVCLGTLAIPQIFAVTRDFYGPRIALLVIGGVWFHGCVVGALMRPINRKKIEEKSLPSTDKHDRDKHSIETENGDSRKSSQYSEILEYDSLSCEDSRKKLPDDVTANHMIKLIIPFDCPAPPKNDNPDGKSHHSRCKYVLGILKTYAALLKNNSLWVRILVVNLGGLGYILPLVAIPPFCRELDIGIYRYRIFPRCYIFSYNSNH